MFSFLIQFCNGYLEHFQWHDDVIKWKHFPHYWPLCGEFTGHQWIARTKASDTELWCFLDQRLNKRFSTQSWGWWFDMPSRPLWCHCNGNGPQGYAIGLYWQVNIGSGNGLVPSGTKPLPYPMLTKTHAAWGFTWPQWVKHQVISSHGVDHCLLLGRILTHWPLGDLNVILEI